MTDAVPVVEPTVVGLSCGVQFMWTVTYQVSILVHTPLTMKRVNER